MSSYEFECLGPIEGEPALHAVMEQVMAACKDLGMPVSGLKFTERVGDEDRRRLSRRGAVDIPIRPVTLINIDTEEDASREAARKTLQKALESVGRSDVTIANA
jgi:hypothetical protein